MAEILIYQILSKRYLENPISKLKISSRKKQSWYFPPCMGQEKVVDEPDVEEMVQRIGQRNCLSEPYFISQLQNCGEVIFLVDREGSMVPFHGFADHLIRIVMGGGHQTRISTYYFHNCPHNHLYRDHAMCEGECLEEVCQSWQADTRAIIFSDAGAARSGYSLQRLELTRSFIEHLRQVTHRISWLNPMPESCWQRTTAEEIAQLVSMFECNLHGLYLAIQELKGE